MRLLRTSLPVFGLLLCTVFAVGQQPPLQSGKGPAKPDPNSLEGLILDALKSHPDIRVAESKVRDAEALLNQSRFQVIQQVSSKHVALQGAKIALKSAETVAELTNRLLKSENCANKLKHSCPVKPWLKILVRFSAEMPTP